MSARPRDTSKILNGSQKKAKVGKKVEAEEKQSTLDTNFHRTTSKYAQKALEKPQWRWQQCRHTAWRCYAKYCIVKVEVYVWVTESELSQSAIAESDKEGSWCVWWDLWGRKFKVTRNHSIHKQFLLHGQVSWAWILGSIQPKENHLHQQQTFFQKWEWWDTVL